MKKLLLLTLLAGAAQAAVIGQNVPIPPLSAERVAATQAPEARDAWLRYLARSQAQGTADRAALAAERVGLAALPPQPESGKAAEKTMPLQQSLSWYLSPAAAQVAENILSFQTPAGGWGKNQPRDRAPRLKGQDYVTDNSPPKRPAAGDFDLAADERWSYVGTIDNDATITEIRFLARMAAVHPTKEAYRQAALKGLDYLLEAQFPNGGWPQVWPLQGGYHDAVTLNDNAVVEVTELMAAVARGDGDFAFAPAALRTRAGAAEKRALSLLLAAQLSVGGKKSIWAQQYEALTLTPASARNYEPPALCTGESTELLMYLMSLPAPTAEVKAAVHTGIAALRALALNDKAWVTVDEVQGRRLLDKPGAGPLWSRYYDPVTLKPVFGDRDKSLHDDVNEISFERRKGYAWFGTWPLKALKAYEDWAKRWGEK